MTAEGFTTRHIDDDRGVLHPARLPSFQRESAPGSVGELVRWFWIPRWDLAPGAVSQQKLLPFPACNLVVEPGGVSLVGPTTKSSCRELRGRGWAVGALLRPAAVAALGLAPRKLRDTQLSWHALDLRDAVAVAMRRDAGAQTNDAAVAVFTDWLATHVGPPDEVGLLSYSMDELIASDRTIVRVDQVATRLSMSTRNVQRLAQLCFGLPPLAIIRRYRLQEAARRLREEPSLTIAEVAAELGYSDHAHLSRDFRDVLGLTPSDYRCATGARH